MPTSVVAQNLELPKLPYEYDALEPAIDAQTMEIHHLKHHAKYLETLNSALTALRADEATKYLAKMGVDKALQHLSEVPEALRGPLRNGGGGFVNHILFFEGMAPNGTKTPDPSEPLGKAIDATFGSFLQLSDAFQNLATKVFGSGWAWLVYDTNTAKMSLMSTPNQDTPNMQPNMLPLLGLDCWEHAYYLKYQNKRPDYIAAFWSVVNWEVVAQRYQAATTAPKAEL
mmetsp:Transcript_36664/g.56877  ORF Transcript_36664/g.56877 Transcript_36664/m.56877 type:complete len:228 (+) Transcript_36664:3-686(+)